VVISWDPYLTVPELNSFGGENTGNDLRIGLFGYCLGTYFYSNLCFAVHLVF
jgi:hypothetical protein